MKKRILIVIGAPVVNMGSQAIVRGLVKNIKCAIPRSIVYVMATDPLIISGLDIPGVNKYLYRYCVNRNKLDIYRIMDYLCRHISLLRRYVPDVHMFRFIRYAKKSDLVFIVGADNYDKSYKSYDYMDETNRYVKRLGTNKFIMYNCSVSEDDINEIVLNDWSRFNHFSARDSISYNNMVKKMPNKDIRFFADIAFTMEPEEVSLPARWAQDKMVGINLSNLVVDGRYGTLEEQILNSYKRVIDFIIHETNLNICFIPHVKNNADLSELQKLYDYVSDKTRVIIINHENYNAAQTKYIISKCKLFLGARTHATIAAYSSFVPTLVVGYSIKSKGIATDLLGTDKGNVVSVSQMVDETILLNAFKNFYVRETEIKNKLYETVPKYIQKAEGVQELIKELIFDQIND